MKSKIIYIDSHEKSKQQARQSLDSFQKYGWDVSLRTGLTPKTLQTISEFKEYKIIENSRLYDFEKQNYNKYLTKLSCAFNHVLFWKTVVEYKEPMAFLEHDAICLSEWSHFDFDEYLILNSDYVFRPPNKLGKQKFRDFTWPSAKKPSDLPNNYPLPYHNNNIWKDSKMAPGTGAYAITPLGAEKMLNAIKKYGIDQSDFMINTFNLKIQYINPSPVKFNTVNLSTSTGI